MQEVAQEIRTIEQSAESMHAAQPERIGSPSAGDVVRQGDLYLVCLDELPPGTETKEKQLAPGTSQGSRHVADGECRVLTPADPKLVAATINRLNRAKDNLVEPELVGPLIECRGETTITHPEHGHKILPAGTNWGTVYQRSLAEEVRRVQD